VKRIHWTLSWMFRQGAVTKEGFGMSARLGIAWTCHLKSLADSNYEKPAIMSLT